MPLIATWGRTGVIKYNYIVPSLALMLAACAGRAPAPVAVVQAQDRYMDCAAISSEAQANTKRIQELGSEEGGKVAQNVIVGVAGILIPVLWFGMDFQNAAGKEVAALQSRQQYLATLAEQRCGAIAPLPIQTLPTQSPPTPSAATVTGAPTPAAATTPAPVPGSSIPVPAPAPAAPARELNCVDQNGGKFVTVAMECPLPSKPAP
jgi:hypothetical protein